MSTTFLTGLPAAYRLTLSTTTWANRSGILGGPGGAVRSQDDVLHLPERMLRGKRFDFEHVEAGAGDLPRLQRRDQIVQVDDDSASDVDQKGGPLHLPELGPPEHLDRFRRMRRGNHDEIALHQQVCQPFRLPERLHARRTFLSLGVDRQHPHPEGQASAGHLRSDAAQTDHAQSGVRKVDVGPVGGSDVSQAAHEVGDFPTGVSHHLPGGFRLIADVVVEIPGEAEDESEDVLGNDVREDAPHVGQDRGMLHQGGEEIVFHAGTGRLYPVQPGFRCQQLWRHLAEEGVGVHQGRGCGVLVGRAHHGAAVTGSFHDRGKAMSIHGGIDHQLEDSLRVLVLVFRCHFMLPGNRCANSLWA